MEEEKNLADSGASNTILREVKYFQILKKKSNGSVITTGGCHTAIAGSGQATFTILSNGTKLMIHEALLYTDSTYIAEF
jgi:hypothetical protein